MLFLTAPSQQINHYRWASMKAKQAVDAWINILKEEKLDSYFDCQISWWWYPGRCSAEPHGPSGLASSLRWPLGCERLCGTLNNITARAQFSNLCSRAHDAHGAPGMDATASGSAAGIWGPKFSQVWPQRKWNLFPRESEEEESSGKGGAL